MLFCFAGFAGCFLFGLVFLFDLLSCLWFCGASLFVFGLGVFCCLWLFGRWFGL